jgi:hypothetical protein
MGMPMSSSVIPQVPLEHLLTGTNDSRRRGLPKKMPSEHINLKFKYEKVIKFKINPIWEHLGLIIYPIKPPAGLFFLIKFRETIPLRELIKSYFSSRNQPWKLGEGYVAPKYSFNGITRN